MAGSTIDDWFASAPEHQRESLGMLRELVFKTGPGIEEALKWGRPCYATDAGLFCYIHRSANHVTLGFQQGTSLDDPDGLLEGDGKDMRHIKFESSNAIIKQAVSRLLKRAYTFER